MLTGFGSGLGSGIVMTLGADFAPVIGRGEFLGVWRLMADLGGSVGPIMIGAIAGAASLGVASVATAGLGLIGSALMIWVLSLWLPKTPIYGTLVSQSASGVTSVAAREQQQHAQLGQIGTAVSMLRPGGKAQFGDAILDVMTQGDLVAKGQRVRIIGHSGKEAIVEAVG